MGRGENMRGRGFGKRRRGEKALGEERGKVEEEGREGGKPKGRRKNEVKRKRVVESVRGKRRRRGIRGCRKG